MTDAGMRSGTFSPNLSVYCVNANSTSVVKGNGSIELKGLELAERIREWKQTKSQQPR